MAYGKPVLDLVREKPDLYHLDPPDTVLEKVHRGGYIENDGKGCTEFGVASSTCELIRTILHDEHKILPCSVKLENLYGVRSDFASVPVRLGAGGVEDILEISLTESEQKAFHASMKILHEHFERALTL